MPSDTAPSSPTPPGLLHRLNPRARARTRMGVAAAAWTVMGVLLSLLGTWWCLQAETPQKVALYLAIALAIGLLPARLVVKRIATRNEKRILERGDGHCLMGFLPWRIWGLVSVMMVLGFFLRHSSIPRPDLGIFYLALGSSLATGGWGLWPAFRRMAS